MGVITNLEPKFSHSYFCIGICNCWYYGSRDIFALGQLILLTALNEPAASLSMQDFVSTSIENAQAINSYVVFKRFLCCFLTVQHTVIFILGAEQGCGNFAIFRNHRRSSPAYCYGRRFIQEGRT